MQPNPYPDEPMSRQPTEANPPMEPLQPANSRYPQYPQNRPPIQENIAYPPQNVQRAAADQESAYTTRYAIGKLIDFVSWVLLVLEVILALRFLLRLIGADPANPFASFLYGLTNVFLFIFKGIVTDPTFGTYHAQVFEVSTLIGMLVYGLIFFILKLFLRTMISRPREPVV